ncbi:protease [Photobacterium proteolyticum]|uniref:Protease n=1 Tax=Photobacterium proteolyticum TaxID=1903952 RepID=A0A1Q9GD24_9GAMM|nr:S8 family peptidase [Photobacterium proteolyticum]OLQ72274.1 protease [Photobacterium proteolyticum]
MKARQFYRSAISAAVMAAISLPVLAANDSVPPVPFEELTTVKGTIIEPVIKEQRTRSKRSLSDAAGQLDGDWFNLDPEMNGIEGSSVDRVYDTISLTPSDTPVVVAVIDSGVDVHHEDLQGKIWENPREIPNNGFDDDFNGYVDDVYGWNFIGGRDGSHVAYDTLAVTREYKRYQAYKDYGVWLTPDEKAYYAGVEKEYLAESEAANSKYQAFKAMYDEAQASKVVLQNKHGQTDFSLAAIEQISSDDPDVTKAAGFLVQTLSTWRSFDYMDSMLERYSSAVDYHYNLDYDPRAEIVKDQPYNPWQFRYGNNDVIGPDASHGTHVAGIIAADRYNQLGVRGVANNVKIMALRVVANGDERDKDVANAVRYAVDNGAKIINMSFGKAYSPYKDVVDEAFRYASRRGVLLVHSAGNSHTDNDIKPSYPNRFPLYYPGHRISTWLDIGASGNYKDQRLATSFTNFGKDSVDVFAPGYKIMSTTPGNNYQAFSGTSMASPVVSGVAALALTYFPDLKGRQLKKAILETVRTYEGHMVKNPATPEVMVPFSELSATGGVVDAYHLLQHLQEKQQ